MFLADQAQEIHLIYLENDFITVNGRNLLAFDAGMDWDIKRVEGVSGMMGGGLFNMSLHGTGWVAILSDGPPVLLDVASRRRSPTPQAAITWSSGVKTGIKTDFKMKNLIGRSSGESIQMAFSGEGWVLVQPSEGRVSPTAARGAADGQAGRAPGAGHRRRRLHRRAPRRRLVAEGARVRAFVRYNSRGERGTLDWLDPAVVADVEVVAGELRDIESVTRAVAGVEVVFHLAAQIAIPYSYVNPRDFVEVNAVGSLNVAQAALAAGVERVRAHVDERGLRRGAHGPDHRGPPAEPQSPYAASKVAADKLMDSFHRSFDLPVAVVRPFNTYGPHQSARAILPTIISQALAGPGLRLGSLHPRRDMTFVEDTAAAFIAVAEADDRVVGRTVQLGTGVDVSIGELVEMVGSAARQGADGRDRPGAGPPAQQRGRAPHLRSGPGRRADGLAPDGRAARRRRAHDRVDRARGRALPRRRVRDLDVHELVAGIVDDLLAARTPPARLERGAARLVPVRLAAAGARAPVREQPERAGQLGAGL